MAEPLNEAGETWDDPDCAEQEVTNLSPCPFGTNEAHEVIREYGRTKCFKHTKWIRNDIWDIAATTYAVIACAQCGRSPVLEGESTWAVCAICWNKQLDLVGQLRNAATTHAAEGQAAQVCELAAHAIEDLQKAWYWKDEDREIAGALLQAAARARDPEFPDTKRALAAASPPTAPHEPPLVGCPTQWFDSVAQRWKCACPAPQREGELK